MLCAGLRWLDEHAMERRVYQRKRRRRRRRAMVVKARSRQSMTEMRVICGALAVIFVISVIQLGGIALRSFRTKKQNDALSALHLQLSEPETSDATWGTQTPVTTAQPESTPSPAPTPTPVQATPMPETPAPTAKSGVVRNTQYQQVGGEALPEMEELYNENRDLIAWIEIPEVLDLPVVYKDNAYYLYRDFYKQKNTSGTIFLDENHPFRENTQNLLLHGHNMKDGSMFGHLARYVSDSTYITNHPFIRFSTLWKREQYVIFAVLDVSLDTSSDRFVNYFTHHTFNSDREFENYVRQLQLKSIYAIPLDVQPSDALLTLSTCLNDDRLVIVARRFREGETRSELRNILRLTVRQH